MTERQDSAKKRRERALHLYMNKKKSIQQVATELGIAYGTAHRDLVLAGAVFRKRGGNTRLVKKDKP